MSNAYFTISTEAGTSPTLSEQGFYASLAKVDPTFPARVECLLERLAEQGCELKLLRKYNVYVDDGRGGRLSVLSITPNGTVEVWGTSSRDRELHEPVGRTYMDRVAALLPEGSVRDESTNPGAWTIRVGGKVGIDLRLMLDHQDPWLSAISALHERLQELEAKHGIES